MNLRIDVYKSKGNWQAKITDMGNHKELWRQSEGYKNKAHCLKIIEELFRGFPVFIEGEEWQADARMVYDWKKRIKSDYSACNSSGACISDSPAYIADLNLERQPAKKRKRGGK